ncbi:MAG: SDR family NAD(P)-dependent oxidoreductase, partial [Akkermansiaceae bacterium]|nr:SDR family NAD(P)-dependent oxidoreductase [Akkermansiaceae bacterium]
MFDLENKSAIVTGAATGIGEGIARLFARAKAHVIIADLNGTAAQAVAESISG